MKTIISLFVALLCSMSTVHATELSLIENMTLALHGHAPVVKRAVSATAPKVHHKQSYIQTREGDEISSLFESGDNMFLAGDITPVIDINLIFNCLSRLGLSEQEYGVIFIKIGSGNWGRMIFTGMKAPVSPDLNMVPQFRCD